MSRGAPRSVIFVGDLTVDLLAEGEPKPDLNDAGRFFSRTAMSAEDWAAYVSTATLGRRVEAHAGGSIANVAAAFATNANGVRMYFVCVEQALSALLRPPFWWQGHNLSAADLRARSITVLGHDVAPRTSETPGALAFVDPLGNVTRLIANNQAARMPVEVPGELLVIRSDHGRRLRREYTESFPEVAVLLADDGLGWYEVPDLLSIAKRGWVFGTVQQIQIVASSLRQSILERVWLVGTDGPRPCLALEGRSGERSLLEVPALPRIVCDLGAGDAYMGGFLAHAAGGGLLRDAHRSGCAAAAAALSHRGARAELTNDLNRIFPDIGRISPLGDEGRVFHCVRCSPGLTVVSGGQTGAESVAIQEAVKLGLPVHAIMPKGLRQESGPMTARQAARLGNFRVHELGSESFRYRTWATVYAADAVVLLDHAGGEGSEEARRAAHFLNRPLLDSGRKPLASVAVAHWLESQGARVVLVAGNRASLLAAKSGTQRLMQRQIRNVMRGLCLINRRLLAGGGEAPLPPQPLRLGVPGQLLENDLIDLLLPDLAVTERVVLPARDLATAFRLRELSAVITWPSLLAKHETENARVVPLGAFPVHYGFLSSAEHPSPGDRLAIQYTDALSDNTPNGELIWRSSFTITGQAEAWLRHGLADVAYDTLHIGATKEKSGLGGFFPSHWETVSLVWR